ncbi:MAG: DUF3667 domain-containing protein [Wenzhouxiangellaceae bacterium]|nr:MAG: DUF3667 domain-containing protein [Wenzhouxiangellaceae bacterium]
MQEAAAQEKSEQAEKSERLCPNCGADLRGPYCHACGQPTRSFIRALPGLIREIAGETLYYDSRMWRTLTTLLFKPGQLSREYVFGKRARYTPPVRLYLVCSILAFLLIGLVINTANVTPWTAQFEDSATEQDSSNPAPPSAPSISFGEGNWDAETNPVEIAWLSEGGNAWINQQVQRIADNSTEVQRNPARLLRTAAGMLPQTMFVLLPLFAMLVGLFYLFSGRYYIEHLLLQVHNHSFLFLILIALYLIASLRSSITDAGISGGGLMAGSLTLLSILIWIWIPVYLWMSLKRFYAQGWLMTTSKFLILAWSYSILLTFGLVAIVLLGLWTL